MLPLAPPVVICMDKLVVILILVVFTTSVIYEVYYRY